MAVSIAAREPYRQVGSLHDGASWGKGGGSVLLPCVPLRSKLESGPQRHASGLSARGLGVACAEKAALAVTKGEPPRREAQ